MTSKAAQQVREFHEVFGCDISPYVTAGTEELRDLRADLIVEESEELLEAMYEADPVGMADALGDLLYVTYGAALAFGIDLDAVVDEIHRSNMSKLGADGKPIYREDGKVLKGPGYFRPDIESVLYGYDDE